MEDVMLWVLLVGFAVGNASWYYYRATIARAELLWRIGAAIFGGGLFLLLFLLVNWLIDGPHMPGWFYRLIISHGEAAGVCLVFVAVGSVVFSIPLIISSRSVRQHADRPANRQCERSPHHPPAVNMGAQSECNTTHYRYAGWVVLATALLLAVAAARIGAVELQKVHTSMGTITITVSTSSRHVGALAFGDTLFENEEWRRLLLVISWRVLRICAFAAAAFAAFGIVRGSHSRHNRLSWELFMARSSWIVILASMGANFGTVCLSRIAANSAMIHMLTPLWKGFLVYGAIAGTLSVFRATNPVYRSCFKHGIVAIGITTLLLVAR